MGYKNTTNSLENIRELAHAYLIIFSNKLYKEFNDIQINKNKFLF